MTDPEVVVRLLAAIDERERKARAAGSLQAMWWQPGGRRNGRNTIREFLTDNAPDSVLRLCQAHRDIVARFQRAWDRRNTGTPDEVAFRQTYVIAMIDVLADLARGYGVEDGED